MFSEFRSVQCHRCSGKSQSILCHSNIKKKRPHCSFHFVTPVKQKEQTTHRKPVMNSKTTTMVTSKWIAAKTSKICGHNPKLLCKKNRQPVEWISKTRSKWNRNWKRIIFYDHAEEKYKRAGGNQFSGAWTIELEIIVCLLPKRRRSISTRTWRVI